MTDPIQANLENVKKLRRLSYLVRNLRTLHAQATEDLEQVTGRGRGKLENVKKKMAELAAILTELETDFDGLSTLVARHQEIDEIEQETVYGLAEAANVAQIPEFARLYSVDFWTQSLQEVKAETLTAALAKLPGQKREKIIELLKVIPNEENL
jgi:hypothetical protein